MSFEHLYGLTTEQHDPQYHERFRTRHEELTHIRKNRVFDIVILGEGITALTLARLASFHGFRTLLIARGDFGVARGTPTYRPFFTSDSDNPSALLQTSHLTSFQRVAHIHKFSPSNAKLISLFRWWLFNRRQQRRSTAGEVRRAVISVQRYAMDLLVSARREGTIAVNYACLNSFRTDEEGTMSVGFTDELDGSRYEIRSGILFNLTGNHHAVRLVPSAQLHDTTSLLRVDFLTDNKHLSSSREVICGKERLACVTTAEGDVISACLELPYDASREHIERRCQKITEETPLQGVIVPTETVDTSLMPYRESRYHSEVWKVERNVFSLTGDYIEHAEAVALGGLVAALKKARRSGRLVGLSRKPFPGTCSGEELVSVCQSLQEQGCSPDSAEQAVRVFGERAYRFHDDDTLLEPISSRILKGSLVHAIRCECGVDVNDIAERRLFLNELTESEALQIQEILSVERKDTIV